MDGSMDDTMRQRYLTRQHVELPQNTPTKYTLVFRGQQMSVSQNWHGAFHVDAQG